MVDLSCEFPSNYRECVKGKLFLDSIVLRRGVLEKFLIDIDDYTGPFKKSIWLDQKTLLKKLKEVGRAVYKNQMNGMYYLMPENENTEPVLFDTNLLELVEEETPEQ